MQALVQIDSLAIAFIKAFLKLPTNNDAQKGFGISESLTTHILFPRSIQIYSNPSRAKHEQIKCVIMQIFKHTCKNVGEAATNFISIF